MFLALLFAVSPGVAASTGDLDRVTAKIICDCGCNNLTVKNCTCGKADRVRSDVAARLESGQTPEQILKSFVDEYGEQILAAPTGEGFNLLGWITPFAAVLLGGTLLVLVLRRWARVPWNEAPLVSPLGPGEARPPDPSLLKRVEEEMRDVER